MKKWRTFSSYIGQWSKCLSERKTHDAIDQLRRQCHRGANHCMTFFQLIFNLSIVLPLRLIRTIFWYNVTFASFHCSCTVATYSTGCHRHVHKWATFPCKVHTQATHFLLCFRPINNNFYRKLFSCVSFLGCSDRTWYTSSQLLVPVNIILISNWCRLQTWDKVQQMH